MGVPVVTWAGQRMCGRQTASFLSRVGLEELAVASETEYVEKALELAGDVALRRSLRSELRDRMRAGPLCAGRRLANAFTSAVERAWREWDVL